MKRKTTEQFIADAKAVHGDMYDYSKVEYIDNKTKVLIICPKHGAFEQRPAEHLRGSGCYNCSIEARSATKDDFIRRANKVHNNKYIYHINTALVLAHDYIEIECPIHGIFNQKANSHLQGEQCALCSRNERKSLIYGVAFNDTNEQRRGVVYKHWHGMICRSYSNIWKARHPAYVDCTCVKEWLLLSNFKRWFDDPANGYQEGYALDKDILVKGNKVYGPDTCCFVPQEINNLMLRKETQRGLYPIGVSRYGDTYVSRGQIYGRVTHLGSFKTPEAAFLAYKKAKEQYVKELAEKYYKEGKITERVYNALLNYRVEITD